MELVLFLIFCCICSSLKNKSSNNKTEDILSDVTKDDTDIIEIPERNDSSQPLDTRYSSNSHNHFYSKIVGVTLYNRQEIIKGLVVGQQLSLVREPDNESDENTISVTLGNDVIGYIKKDIAQYMAPIIDAGYNYICEVQSITGDEDSYYGVNISLDRFDIEFTCLNCKHVCYVPYDGDFTCPNCNELLSKGNH